MNKNEVIDVLNNLDFLDEYEYDDITVEGLEQYQTYYDEDDDKYQKIDHAIKFLQENDCHIENVEQHGGMDQGSDYWVVFKVGDFYVKNTNYYQSHYGLDDWTGARIVEAKQVNKTIYI